MQARGKFWEVYKPSSQFHVVRYGFGLLQRNCLAVVDSELDSGSNRAVSHPRSDRRLSSTFSRALCIATIDKCTSGSKGPLSEAVSSEIRPVTFKFKRVRVLKSKPGVQLGINKIRLRALACTPP
jgi:hypothetical protein